VLIEFIRLDGNRAGNHLWRGEHIERMPQVHNEGRIILMYFPVQFGDGNPYILFLPVPAPFAEENG
jgi:hypothetical protein